MLARSLERSESTPLSLFLRFDLWEPMRSTFVFLSVLELISPHLLRCYSFSIIVSDTLGVQYALPLPGQLSNLIYLRLETYGVFHLSDPIFEEDSVSPLEELCLTNPEAAHLGFEDEWLLEVPVSRLKRERYRVECLRFPCAMSCSD